MAALAAVSVAAILLLLWHTAGAQNRLAMASAVHIAETALQAEQETVGLFTRDYAWWDDAVAHLARPEPDTEWASGNIGPYVAEALNLPASYVVAPDGRLAYAHDAAAAGPAGGDGLDRLVTAARRQTGGMILPATGVLALGGVPHVVAAAPLIGEAADIADAATAYVLVFARPLDAARLENWSRAYRLPGLAFHAGAGGAGAGEEGVAGTGAAGPGVAALRLEEPGGRLVGWLRWQPELPGAVLLLGTLPALLVALTLIGALLALFLHRAARSAQALERANQLAGMGRMAASMAHELSQPLNVIRMAAENIAIMAAEDAVPDREFLRGRSQAIAAQAARMGELVHHMRASAGALPRRATVFDAGPALQAGLDQVRHELAATGARIEVALPAEPARVLGSAVQLEQVVVNLLTNARDAVNARPEPPPGGHVIALRAACREGRLMVQVRDTGNGIDPATAERLFEPFFTTKPVGSGTGLGLWVCRQLIAGMGGTIRARNTGRGTAMDFHLPLNVDPVS